MPIDDFEWNYSSQEHDKLNIFQVPSLYGKQGAQLISVALLVVARTWISDRIAYLNGELETFYWYIHACYNDVSQAELWSWLGTSVKHVLEQDKAAFIRLTGVSVLQSAASAVVAPSLRWTLFKIIMYNLKSLYEERCCVFLFLCLCRLHTQIGNFINFIFIYGLSGLAWISMTDLFHMLMLPLVGVVPDIFTYF